MKKMYLKTIAIMIMLVALMASAAPVSAAAAKIKLDKTAVSLCQGKTVKIKATVIGGSKKVTWTSSNRNVAKVNSNGIVTGIGPGRTVIMARVNGKTSKCVVTVYQSYLRLPDFNTTGDVNTYMGGYTHSNTYYMLNVGGSWAYRDYNTLHAAQYNIKKSNVVRTARGIRLGASKADVKRVYGNGSAYSFSTDTDRLYMVNKNSESGKYVLWRVLKNARSVLVYTYSHNTSYSIRFYFNKANKLISIVYVKNYNYIRGTSKQY